MQAAFLPLARIIKAHGLKGEVSVSMLTSLPFGIPVGLSVWLVPPPATIREAVVESVRPGPKGPLVKLSGVDTIDAAAQLAGSSIIASSDDVSPVHVEEVFDPIGCAVVDGQRGLLGSITDVIVTGANDVYVVDGERYGQVLIPAIEQVVLGIDERERLITVELLPGLIEEDE